MPPTISRQFSVIIISWQGVRIWLGLDSRNPLPMRFSIPVRIYYGRAVQARMRVGRYQEEAQLIHYQPPSRQAQCVGGRHTLSRQVGDRACVYGVEVAVHAEPDASVQPARCGSAHVGCTHNHVCFTPPLSLRRERKGKWRNMVRTPEIVEEFCREGNKVFWLPAQLYEYKERHRQDTCSLRNSDLRSGYQEKEDDWRCNGILQQNPNVDICKLAIRSASVKFCEGKRWFIKFVLSPNSDCSNSCYSFNT